MKTLEKLTDLLENFFEYKKIKNITLDSNITDDFHMDSLDMYEMLIQIEDEFKINIPTEMFEKIDTVADLVEIIERVQKGEIDECVAI